MKNLKKIAIIGVGIMGGSLALAIKKNLPQIKVHGYARTRKSLLHLHKLKLMDTVSCDLAEVVKQADFIILSLPIYAIVEYFTLIAPFLKPKAIVIDLGSTKDLIEKQAKKILPKNVSFVGCHPLCGSDKSGVDFSRADLYQKQICLITGKRAAADVKKFWLALGSKPIMISPKDHDRILSALSHLTHLVSFAYTDFIDADYLKFCVQSLKDMTRISNSPAHVWADILLSNRANIIADIERFKSALAKFVKLLDIGDKNRLTSHIKKINKKQSLII